MYMNICVDICVVWLYVYMDMDMDVYTGERTNHVYEPSGII